MKRLLHAPITEAVVDIECDMPTTFDVASFEGERGREFGAGYPIVRKRLIEHHHIKTQSNKPSDYEKTSATVQALLFMQQDEKQLIQARAQGYSFNRLAPYSTFDEYLPEIKRTWGLFVKLGQPFQIRSVGLRFINRILLPLKPDSAQPGNSPIDLADYLTLFPRLPEKTLLLTSFLHQYSATEDGTKNTVNTVVHGAPIENNKAPIILDISTFCPGPSDVSNWQWIEERLQSLRDLKNRVFQNTVTEECLNLFQQP